MNKYSDQERKLAKVIGCEDFMEKIQPITLYHMMVEKCFLENRQDSAADAVRKALINFNSVNKIYRMTPEFDELIQF